VLLFHRKFFVKRVHLDLKLLLIRPAVKDRDIPLVIILRPTERVNGLR